MVSLHSFTKVKYNSLLKDKGAGILELFVVFRPRDFCPPGSLGGSVKGVVTLNTVYPELAFVFGLILEGIFKEVKT